MVFYGMIDMYVCIYIYAYIARAHVVASMLVTPMIDTSPHILLVNPTCPWLNPLEEIIVFFFLGRC